MIYPRTVKLHNTETGNLTHIEEHDLWTIYVCGPTVYDVPHIGNARPAIVFGTLVNMMRKVGMGVKYVSNYTDIDDKIILRAEERGIDIGALTDQTIQSYHASISGLGVVMPDLNPRATESIPEMISLISRLIDLGHAYQSEGHVLFDTTSSNAEFLKRGGTNTDYARVDAASYKRNQADFVLWKPEWKGVGWDSPFGRGRPGWHIECSAMVKEHLGETIDIHGGGQDLIFPHHEAECQQSYCANRAPLARLWAHCGMVRHNGKKMAKSDGTFITVDEILDRGLGDALRFAMLSTHYRQPFDYTEQKLIQAQETLKRLWDASEKSDDGAAHSVELSDGRIRHYTDWANLALDTLNSDFNTPHFISEISRPIRSGGVSTALELLGFSRPTVVARELPEDIKALMNKRQIARLAKDYALSDRLRVSIAEAGIEVLDNPDGSSDWKWV